MLLLLFLSCLSLSCGITAQVFHSSYSIKEDEHGWVRFNVNHTDCITSVTLYKKMQDILYPSSKYIPYVYYEKGKVENLNDCKVDESSVSLNTRISQEFWNANKAYVMIAQDKAYSVVMLINLNPITTFKPTTLEPTIETTKTEATTLEPTIETTKTEATTLETTTETTKIETTTTENVPTEKAASNDVKSENTSPHASPDLASQKNIAILLLCAFALLVITLLVVVTSRAGSATKSADDNDFFSKHKKDDDNDLNHQDEIVVEDDAEKDMQILMAMGKGAKPSFSINLY